MGEVDTEPLML